MPDVYVSQIDFGDGILRSFKGEGGGGITDFVDVPTIEETELVYDGTQKELVFDDLDTDKVTVSGSTATEVGTYTCTLTLKSEGYFWKDLTNEPKSIEWAIVPVHVYGAEWDGTATTTWTRTDDAAEFEDPNPYMSGASSYGSPFDNLMPWAGMTIEERTGGTMVKIPKFWYKLTQDGDKLKIQIADKVKDGFYVSPAHMDRGDGKGERDYIYVGRYHSNATNYKSTTSLTPVSSTLANIKNYLHSLGSGIWLWDFSTVFTIWLLYLVEFADWDSQSKIGYGCGTGSAISITGYTDSMPYHTGTTQSSRTTYGFGTQYRNIEGLWDNIYDFINGCKYGSSYMYINIDPSSDEFGIPVYLTSVTSSGGYFPKSMLIRTVDGLFPLFTPSSSGGTSSTYVCDKWEHYVSSSVAQEPIICIGGFWNTRSTDCGLFHILSIASGNEGGRLMELPNNS